MNYINKFSGLSTADVEKRKNDGFDNKERVNSTKSIKSIIYDNLFTLFNLINIILALAIIYVGSFKNLMFMGVVVFNFVIGTVQQLRAKKAIDKLSLISAKKVKVIRNGKQTDINLDEIVIDDIVCFSSGEQIVSDCVILDGNCEINESLLTGEPNSITKHVGDNILSGSFVVSGSCIAKVVHVGADNYVATILHDAKYIKDTDSEIMTTIKRIIKIISFAIIPIGSLLFYKQLLITHYDVNSVIVSVTATLIGMIPEGLVLLVSTVLSIGVIKMSKNKILVQDMYSIETLARVDTLCLDKTGTITEGTFEIKDIIPQNNHSQTQLINAVKMIVTSLNDSGSTFETLKNKFGIIDGLSKPVESVPFSSEKKWSGVYFKDKGSYVMGAAEFVFKDKYNHIQNFIEKYSKNYRILTIAHSNSNFVNCGLPNDLEFMGVILLKDKIRPNAKKIIKYFADEDVNVKIISGDNPITISKIANDVLLKNSDKYIDVTNLNSYEELKSIVEKYTIFGRVTPKKKQDLIKAMKSCGHTVAMAGDGVNDVLALKEADCSIAIANGSDVARNVSHMILLDSDFIALPKVVEEGRRIINNIQRSASLFLTKTIYSIILAVLFLFVEIPIPFIPIQMTLISSLTIGIPSFILALEPNSERVKKNLFKIILNTSLPTALTIVINIMLTGMIYLALNLTLQQYSTMVLIVTGLIGILLIYRISIPFTLLRKILLFFVSTSFVFSIILFKDFFAVAILNLPQILLLLILMLISVSLFDTLHKITNRFIKF